MQAGDPGDRRVRKPSRTRTFQPGRVDPEIEMKRPLLTWGNAVLVIIMLAFGLYATGNLPQVDEFFNYLDRTVRSHNNGVVSAIIMYVPILVGLVLLAIVSWLIFLFINSRRRRQSDEKGWHLVTRDVPNRVRRERRQPLEDEPSLIMPLGKERRAADGTVIPTTGDRRKAPELATAAPTNAPAASSPAPVTATETAPTEAPAMVPALAPEIAVKAAEVAPGFAAAVKPVPVLSAREKALLAAAKAEAALATAPQDLPSFVVPAGKLKKAGGGTIAATAVAAATVPTPAAVTPVAATPPPAPPPVAVATPPDPPAPPAATAEAPTAPTAPPEPATPPTPVPDLEALAAAAKAAATMAAAQAEVAKAELAMATARAEAAKAELALLAAKAEAGKPPA